MVCVFFENSIYLFLASLNLCLRRDVVWWDVSMSACARYWRREKGRTRTWEQIALEKKKNDKGRPGVSWKNKACLLFTPMKTCLESWNHCSQHPIPISSHADTTTIYKVARIVTSSRISIWVFSFSSNLQKESSLHLALLHLSSSNKEGNLLEVWEIDAHP